VIFYAFMANDFFALFSALALGRTEPKAEPDESIFHFKAQ
jgi:hypothetical protein